MRTPKQVDRKKALYQYYAGFSEDFVSDILRKYASPGMRILDPWNGSGTTTKICSHHGINSVGLDINPAMLPIAWARHCNAAYIDKICELIYKAVENEVFIDVEISTEDDLIEDFFEEKSCSLLRSVRNWLVVISKRVSEGLSKETDYAISGFCFLIFAEVIREALRPLRGTNPSWFRRPKNPEERITLSQAVVWGSLRRIAFLMRQKSSIHVSENMDKLWPELFVGDVRQDVASLGKVDMVISSPPYCTRIDYAVATIPELIALGTINNKSFEALRHAITGTVLTQANEFLDNWDKTSSVAKAMRLIFNHPSKASSTYYTRYFSRYFSDLRQSIEQLVDFSGATYFAMVVQSSYFKDVEINLGKILCELFEQRECRIAYAASYPSRPTIAGSNPRVKSYRNLNIQKEDVLIFEKFRG